MSIYIILSELISDSLKAFMLRISFSYITLIYIMLSGTVGTVDAIRVMKSWHYTIIITNTC